MLRIRIDNMNCGGCAKGVRTTLVAIVPSAETHFDLGTKEVRIEAMDAAPILAALRKDGWQAHEAAG
jgi:copper chaperone